jgi:hypothetical protein
MPLPLPFELASASGASVLIYHFLQKIWTYVERNGVVFSVKVRFGPVPKSPRKQSKNAPTVDARL